MSFPGSGPLMQYAGRQIGKRVVRQLGISKEVGAALGLPVTEDEQRERNPRMASDQQAVVRPPLQTLDRATERAIGERAFQASMAYLETSDLSDESVNSIAQAVAHAVVEALDTYLSRQKPSDEV